jgi:RNA processing factor Prp31
MRFLYLFLIIALVGCTRSTGQSPSNDLKEEQEFQEMMKKTQQTAELSTETQKKATEKEAQIVNQTIEQIVDLKSEVNALKKELNSIHSDTSVKFNLLPISDN